ncbi:MAG: hypothetical protein Q4G67_05495 [Actinomycetia bacterium]|nr:hypothetical protein [Actinomycetes bacterium]
MPTPERAVHGPVDAMAVSTPLAGIQISDGEACPWTGQRVLVVFPVSGTADADGRELVVGEERFTVGDVMISSTPMELPEGFDCGGEHWPEAIVLSSAPAHE